MKAYQIQVDLTGGGNFIVLAENMNEAIDYIRSFYTVEIEEDDLLMVDEREIDEPGVLFILE